MTTRRSSQTTRTTRGGPSSSTTSILLSAVLPRHRPPTQLGFLQCFIDPILIDTFVTNTNLYAAARQATAWAPVTSEEMWRYMAIRIRQGIIVLHELHQYWEEGYRDPIYRSAHVPESLL
jgi:hypothetical protein